MVSIKQLQANRQNAQKSTGPKTPEGKTKVSQNAVTHGLTSRRPVLSIEDKDEFDLHANEVLVWLDPQDPIEKILARRTAMLSWRLQRASVYETLVLENLLTAEAEEVADSADHLGQIIAADFQNAQTLTKIQRYETQLERSMLRCVNTLKRIRNSKLMTYSKIKEYVRGSEEQPEPYFQDENAEAKFPAHLENQMSWRRPQKQDHSNPSPNEELKTILPLCLSETSVAKLQNEPISPINNPVDPVNPVKKDFDAPPPLRPRWSTVVLNDVGYSEKARSKMTQAEREEAADRVLMDMKDPEQYLHDRNLIDYSNHEKQYIPA